MRLWKDIKSLSRVNKVNQSSYGQPSVILDVETVSIPKSHQSLQTLDWRFRLAQIPLIGRWLSRGGYTTGH